MLSTTILDAIGHTPLIQLRPTNASDGRLYAKLELLNPFGMKDRVARHVLLEARAKGLLQAGAPIIESSSGTMALGLALVGTYLGHDVHIVTDPRIDAITLAKLKALNSTVHIVDKMGSGGWQGTRLAYLAKLLEQYPDAFWPKQYENPSNPETYTELANEMLEDLGHIDILVGSVGSGGSLSGTARALQKHNPYLRTIAVDAVGSAIFGQPDQPGRLQGGLGNSLIPPNVDFDVIDEVHWLSDAEAFAGTLELAANEKIFAGNSSGSVYTVARWIATQVPQEVTIAAIFPDRGDRYTGTIYSEDYRKAKNISDATLTTRPRQVPPGTTVTHWSFTPTTAIRRKKDVQPVPCS